MHQRIKKILTLNDQLSIQYIFSSFNKELNSSNLFLIHAYLNNSKQIREKIYDEWFEKGKNQKMLFFNEHKFSPEHIDKDVEREFLKHEEWKEATKLSETPTILVNGYKLPNNYSIEDLRFITKL